MRKSHAYSQNLANSPGHSLLIRQLGILFATLDGRKISAKLLGEQRKQES
jgi:hypothetical protein